MLVTVCRLCLGGFTSTYQRSQHTTVSTRPVYTRHACAHDTEKAVKPSELGRVDVGNAGRKAHFLSGVGWSGVCGSAASLAFATNN